MSKTLRASANAKHKIEDCLEFSIVARTGSLPIQPPIQHGWDRTNQIGNTGGETKQGNRTEGENGQEELTAKNIVARKGQRRDNKNSINQNRTKQKKQTKDNHILYAKGKECILLSRLRKKDSHIRDGREPGKKDKEQK